MNPRLLGFVLSGLGLVCLAGCSSSPPQANIAKKGNGNGQDKRKHGLDVLRQATEVGHFREALQFFNADLQTPEVRAKLVLSPENRKFLQATAGLNADELAEVEATSFRPPDAYHLDEAFLFRDAAQSLEIPGLDAAQLAQRGFDWVVRHVRPHEQNDDWLPPSQVLRRGYGNARDRGLVFLRLVRQFRMEGCLLVLPRPTPQAVLVAVLTPDKKDFYLFDPRLGLPVRTPDGTVATLTAAQKEPALLAPSRITPAQVKTLEAWQVFPLYGVSPRMRELESILANNDRIFLHVDPLKEHQDFDAATDLKVQVWNAPGEGNAVEPSPTRALRLFLPPEEGGIDTGNRYKRYVSHLIPWSTVLLNLNQLKVYQDLPEPGRERLVQLAADLFTKYSLQPHEFLLRGQSDRSADTIDKRLDRIRLFLEDASLLDLGEDAAFQKEVAEWRGQLNEAYRDLLVTKDAKAQARVNALWGDDTYLFALLQTDSEERPEKFKKKTLTKILAYATRDTLAKRAAWIQAMAGHDKAERAQASLTVPAKDTKAGQAAARNAWISAHRMGWNHYLSVDFGPVGIPQRLDLVQERLRLGDDANAVGLLEHLHLELHRYFAARQRLAEAVYYGDNVTTAVSSLQSALDELDQVTQKGALAKVVGDLQKAAQPGPNNTLPQRLDLLARDWAEDGHVAWLRRRMQRQLELWNDAPAEKK